MTSDSCDSLAARSPGRLRFAFGRFSTIAAHIDRGTALWSVCLRRLRVEQARLESQQRQVKRIVFDRSHEGVKFFFTGGEFHPEMDLQRPVGIRRLARLDCEAGYDGRLHVGVARN